ncbi:MAG: SAM-dependent chlorinase/fluorinase [Desulfobacterales bacterium]|jgi:hypothetical protein
MSIITLLTDFGVDDEYVGLMKGVVLTINPDVTIVDITHHIGPQDIVQAAYTISSTYPYFPAGTIHLIVVDPGVGTERAILAVKANCQFFLAPDNGVLTLLLNEDNEATIIRVTNSNYFLNPVSHTFHGRDIFSPVGAHISRGVNLKAFGTETDLTHVVRLKDFHAQIDQNGDLIGRVVSIDNFGNLITNIDAGMLAHSCKTGSAVKACVTIGGHVVKGLSTTYANVELNTPAALIGSRGYMEIAVNGGSAAQFFNIHRGDNVQVKVKPGSEGRPK